MSNVQDKPSSAHITPLSVDDLSEVQDIIDAGQKASGYVSTSMRLMAHKPDILRAFSVLFSTVVRTPSDITQETKWLVAHAVSTAAGCRYCQAHTASNGSKSGLSIDKVEALLRFEDSPVFNDSERAVVAFGLAAGGNPSSVVRRHFDDLREHFNEAQIIELVAVISMFGWLNRWNDTLASDLEDAPLAFASEHLGERGWDVGKHRT